MPLPANAMRTEEIGIKADEIAKLDANENLHPVPVEMMKAVR